MRYITSTITLLLTLGLTGLLASWSWADTAQAPTAVELERYHQMQQIYLEVQIDNLYNAIELLQQRELTDQEHYELIGLPGFAAFDQAFKEHGYTRYEWSRLSNHYPHAIQQWQQAHPEYTQQMNNLTKTREQLMQTYDQLFKHTAN